MEPRKPPCDCDNPPLEPREGPYVDGYCVHSWHLDCMNAMEEARAEVERLRKMLWDNRWHRSERDRARDALKVAHHALTTVHGLWATDLQPSFPQKTLFRLDKSKALEQIEAAMGDE